MRSITEIIPVPNSIVDFYPLANERYDELLLSDSAGALGGAERTAEGSATRTPRLHWQALLSELRAAPAGTMRDRVQMVQRQVRENGVTYNVYADPQGADRPWELDVVPFILPADEWAAIEAAVIQRAELMNEILLDVYGEQKLLRDGHIPPALVFGNEGFLRPCHGIVSIGGVALQTYAVDLARAPNGQWWVVSDRTQAPSGAGYALENRLAIARAFPDLFRELKVQRLAGYFAAWRESLIYWGRLCTPQSQADAYGGNDRPLIVLLTPGPYNETYYEQSYLARYLGFPLVQGSDLTVREGFVFLKTLAGLQRVSVILRRLDDDFCDPLELREDSALGVPGLTEAARRGTVMITNSLGSNILESGALLGFLPKLAQVLKGQNLLMPSVATWWCGEPAALQEAIRRMDTLVFKPAFGHLKQKVVFGDRLSDLEKDTFKQLLMANPQNYLAQEFVKNSQVPVWKPSTTNDEKSVRAGVLGASEVVLRVFACATPSGYQVMPGGLTRVATNLDSRSLAMQRGGGSKDTWVLTTGAVNETTLIAQATGSNQLIRSDTQLASRTVENLFWFGRYAERCDNTVRLMRRMLDDLIDVTPDARGNDWAALVSLCQEHELLAKDTQPNDPAIERCLLNAMHSDEVAGLGNHVNQLFRVAFSLRERLSADNWRALNYTLQQLGKPKPDLKIGEALLLLDEASISLMTLTGFALDGMTRDMGWRFMSIGRRLERLQFMTSVLQHAIAKPDLNNLDWMLELGDSTITYRSRYMAKPEWLPTLDLLVLDPANPRSLLFQLDGLVGALKRVSAVHGECGFTLLEPLLADFKQLDVASTLRYDSAMLKQLLDRLKRAGVELSEQLEARFFSYAAKAKIEVPI
jgi:uncharacterized circularly permuted ATP-grasp superfamily protein/uncharacterized alpha-E superfamily protein